MPTLGNILVVEDQPCLPLDLIILDVMLPGQTGFVVCKGVRLSAHIQAHLPYFTSPLHVGSCCASRLSPPGSVTHVRVDGAT